ncbi:hypothetical protein Agub_g10978, partial [Astrephomene gubernaculifera]
SAWQLLLEATRVADWVRPMVPFAREPQTGLHVVLIVAQWGCRALLDLASGRSLTAKPREWNPFDPRVGMRPLTFLTLLERFSLLALAVTTGGMNNLVVPVSLVLDHMTQPGLAELFTYTMRHVPRVTPASMHALHADLCRVCDVLCDLICNPQRLVEQQASGQVSTAAAA